MSNLLNRFDVAKLIGQTDRTAFKLIKRLNNELEQKGKIIFPGKIDRDYFFERCAISEPKEVQDAK